MVEMELNKVRGRWRANQWRVSRLAHLHLRFAVIVAIPRVRNDPRARDQVNALPDLAGYTFQPVSLSDTQRGE